MSPSPLVHQMAVLDPLGLLVPEAHFCHAGTTAAAVDREALATYRFVWTVAASFSIGVAAFVAFAAYGNPWGNFGRVGFNQLYNARLAKTEFIDDLPAEARPQVLVLGSSSLMRMLPATIERELGKTAFNYSVFWGRAEDLLCITRHVVHDLDYRPELLIVGMDTWTCEPRGNTYTHPLFPGIRRRLLNTPALVRHFPEYNWLRLAYARYIDCFSSQQIRNICKQMHDEHAARQVLLPLGETEYFSIDGTRRRYGDVYGASHRNIFHEVEAGRYPISAYLQDQADTDTLEMRQSYRFKGLGPSRVAWLKSFVEVCAGEGIEIVFVLNPVHPVFWDALVQHTHHLHNLAELRALLDGLEHECANVIGTVDATRIGLFGGDPEAFFDDIHFATHNADLIVAQVAELVHQQ